MLLRRGENLAQMQESVCGGKEAFLLGPSRCFLGKLIEPLGTATFSHRSHCPGLGACVPHFRGGRLPGGTELPWVLLPLLGPRPRECPRCVLPRSGLFCQSPASAPVLCLLPAPRLSPLCSHFS